MTVQLLCMIPCKMHVGGGSSPSMICPFRSRTPRAPLGAVPRAAPSDPLALPTTARATLTGARHRTNHNSMGGRARTYAKLATARCAETSRTTSRIVPSVRKDLLFDVRSLRPVRRQPDQLKYGAILHPAPCARWAIGAPLVRLASHCPGIGYRIQRVGCRLASL